MCGRFAQKKLPREYATTIRAVPSLFDWNPRYNLSPGQNALAVRKTDPESQAELMTKRKGFPAFFTSSTVSPTDQRSVGEGLTGMRMRSDREINIAVCSLIVGELSIRQ